MNENNGNVIHTCPKCDGQMERGGLRGDKMSLWGHRKESTIFGVHVVDIGSPFYMVDAYRCEKCGYLELYAVNEHRK